MILWIKNHLNASISIHGIKKHVINFLKNLCETEFIKKSDAYRFSLNTVIIILKDCAFFFRIPVKNKRSCGFQNEIICIYYDKNMKPCCSLVIKKDNIMQKIQRSVDSHLVKHDRMSPSNAHYSACDKLEINSVCQRRDSFSSCSSDSAVYCSSRHMKIHSSVPDVSNQLQSVSDFHVKNATSNNKRERHSSGSSVVSNGSNCSIKELNESSGNTNASCYSQSSSGTIKYVSSNDFKNTRGIGNKLTSHTTTPCTLISSSKTVMSKGSDSFSSKEVSKQSPPQMALYHHDLRKNIRRKACCHGDCNETHTTFIVRRYTDSAPHQHPLLLTTSKQNTLSSSTSGSSLESSPNNKKRKSELDKLYESLHEIKWAKHFSPENILKQNEARRLSSSPKSLNISETAVKSTTILPSRNKKDNFEKHKISEKRRESRKKSLTKSILKVTNSTDITRNPEIFNQIKLKKEDDISETHVISDIEDSPNSRILIPDALFLKNAVPAANYVVENLNAARLSSNSFNHLISVKPNLKQVIEHNETSKSEINFHKVVVHHKSNELQEYSKVLKEADSDTKNVYMPFSLSNKLKFPNETSIVHTADVPTASKPNVLKINLQAFDKNETLLNTNSNVQCKSFEQSTGSSKKISACRNRTHCNPNIVQLQTCNSLDVTQSCSLQKNPLPRQEIPTASNFRDILHTGPNTATLCTHTQGCISEGAGLEGDLSRSSNSFSETEANSQLNESSELPLLSSEGSPNEDEVICEIPPILEPCIILPGQLHKKQQNQYSISKDVSNISSIPSTQISKCLCSEEIEGNHAIPGETNDDVNQVKDVPQEIESDVSSSVDDIEILELHQVSEESDCILLEPESVCPKLSLNKVNLRRHSSSSDHRVGRLILRKYIRSLNKRALFKTKFKKTVARNANAHFEEKYDLIKKYHSYESDEGNQSLDSLDEISVIGGSHVSEKGFNKVHNDNHGAENRTLPDRSSGNDLIAVNNSLPSSDNSSHFHFSPDNHLMSSNQASAHCSSQGRTDSSISKCDSDTNHKLTQLPVMKHRPYIHGIKKSAVEDNQLTLFPTDEPFSDDIEVVSEEEVEMDTPEEVVRLRLLYGFTLHYKGITVNKNDSYTQVILKLSSKSNIFLSIEALTELKDTLNNAENDSNCQVLIVSGIGSTFCSGLDLKPLIGPQKYDASKAMAVAVKEFIEALASFHKPLVAVVNGAAVGLGVTLLTYCDVVLASNTATFRMPYSQLGYMPEGAATLTLPQVIGSTVAMDMLLRGRKLTAHQALDYGLVSEVLAASKLPHQLVSRVRILAENPVSSMESTKSMLRWHLYGKLHVALENEVEMLPKQWLSPTCQLALKNAFQNGLLGD